MRVGSVTPAPGYEWLYRLAAVFVLGVLPALWLVGLLVHWYGSDSVGFDLRYAFLPAAENVLAGDSPYPAPGDPAIVNQHAYVYSPLVAFLLVPLTVVTTQTAIHLGVVVSLAACVGVLLLLDVRDWRCYTIALVWPPVLNSAMTVSVSLLLALLVAAAWRWRGHELRSGALLGCAAAVKTFVWPLVLWPLLTGRARGSVAAVVTGLALAFGSWALIGFAGLGSYPDLLRTVTESEEHESYSLTGTLLELGAGEVAARGVAVLVTVGLLALAAVLGRRGDETRAFVTLLLASLVATPILWQHYLVLLLVALAVTRPRLSVAWFAPLALWAAPWTGNGEPWQTALVPLVAAIVGTACLLPRRPARADGRVPVAT